MAKLDLIEFDKGVFLANVLGLVYNPKTKKLLIGRRENDPYVKELSWSFPGGRPTYGKSLEASLVKEIKIKTGVKVKVRTIILARIPKENKQFLLLYYLCETNQTKIKAGEKFVEVKWIKPREIQKYFKTSIHPQLLNFLKVL
jgi:ADP-ribose pyrophosphatase YjhB (NUDIX family)